MVCMMFIAHTISGCQQAFKVCSPDAYGQVRAKVENSLDTIPSAILGDYFGRRDVLGNLFQIAKELEELSVAREFKHHTTSSNEARGFLGCLLDYWGIDRSHLALVSNNVADGNQEVLNAGTEGGSQT